MSFPDGYSRTKFINELKFGIQSDTTNKKVKFVIKLIQLPVSKWKWFQQTSFQILRNNHKLVN